MPKAKPSPLLLLTTVAKKADATRLAKTLVEERLAACVSILPAAESRYVWKDRLCVEREFVLLIKTLGRAYARLEKRLRTIHPYECPELIAVPIGRILPTYLSWLKDQVRL